jgi:hypothetical protein
MLLLNIVTLTHVRLLMQRWFLQGLLVHMIDLVTDESY